MTDYEVLMDAVREAPSPRDGVMSSQQLADILLSQWQELWPMPPAERIKRIDDLRAVMERES